MVNVELGLRAVPPLLRPQQRAILLLHLSNTVNTCSPLAGQRGMGYLGHADERSVLATDHEGLGVRIKPCEAWSAQGAFQLWGTRRLDRVVELERVPRAEEGRERPLGTKKRQPGKASQRRERAPDGILRGGARRSATRS